jgi:hypothetical protein
MASSASAHRPTISAEAVCDLETNLIVINYVSTAWGGFPNDPASRQNSQVDILRDGPLADSGAYEDPDIIAVESARYRIHAMPPLLFDVVSNALC